MGGSSLESITVKPEENNKSGEKTLYVKKGSEEHRLKIYEQIDKIKIEENVDQEIKFCMKNPYVGTQECAKIFDIDDNGFSDEINGYAIVGGKECTSLVFRPGAVLMDYNEDIKDYTFKGNLCKLEYRGPPVDDTVYDKCCLKEFNTEDTEKKCNSILNNNYETSHCNKSMLKFCRNNPEDVKCITWMEQRTKNYDDTPLVLYNELCKLNHEEKYCTYMCMISRKYHDHFSKFCDDSLITWCKNNNSNACTCTNSQNRILSDYEKYLGPKECWLAECMLGEQKWKTTDQLRIQKDCNILSCNISIGKLNVSGEAKIDLINNCMPGGVSSREAFSDFIEFTDIQKLQTYGSLFNPFLMLLFISTILFFVTYFYSYNDKPYKEVNI